MKRRRLAAPIMLAAPLAAVCLYPPFARAWAQGVALPALRLLTAATMRLPFSLLEWVLVAFCALALYSAARRWMRRGPFAALWLLTRRLVGLILAAVLSLVALWLPLYSVGDAPAYAASREQLIASCEALIDALNETDLDFSILPEDLPAKRAAFPFWMRAFGISGFFSFPTGEALISPELADSAAPFVAVHEAMHARGHAGEGAANIAAWEECISRGGLYADSARLWALKYSMEAIYDLDPLAYARLRRRMRESTFAAFRQVGGGRRSRAASGSAQAVFSALGVGAAAGDYEILAVYLASALPV